MNLKSTFKKQGGMSLIKQYWKNGSLITAMAEFLLLGKSRTALEILRLSTHLKAKRKLEKLYKKKLVLFNENYIDNVEHLTSNKVWICWFQGMENAPELVKKCYKSLVENLTNKEVIVITSKNMTEYVQFPDYILEKWKKGYITHTHMTDLLRLELLIKYGGTWIDATVFCSNTEENIPKYFFDSDLFFFQSLKPGRDGHSHINSSWYINAKSNNKLLSACRFLCYEYWKEHNDMIDYFLLHDFMAICLEFYPEVWNAIVPRENATPHILLLRLFKMYDEKIWESVKNQTPFHKLSYKYEKEQENMKGTYFDMIFNHGGIT